MIINCADAITLLKGNLTVSVERLYKLYNEITGDNLYTHQLVRAFKEYEPIIRATLPELAAWLDDPDNQINTSNWREVVDKAKAAFGDRFEVPQCVGWKHQDPLSELSEMIK